MSLTALNCPTPIRRRRPLQARDFATRDRAIEQFDAGEYLAAIESTIAHAFPGLSDIRLPLSVVQGSARIHIGIDDGVFCISSRLATLSADSNATALLRFVLSRLSGTGQIHQPRLRDGVLVIEFKERIEHLHPLKLLEALNRIPIEASGHDQWLTEQFAVQRPDRAPLQALSEDEAARAAAFWQSHWADMAQLHNEARRRRSVRMLDFVGSFAANAVRLVLPLHGSLRVELDEYDNEFSDRDEAVSKRDSALARCIREMQAVDPLRLNASLGHAEYASNPLREGSPSLLHSMFGPGERMQSVNDHRSSGRSLEACLELFAYFTYVLSVFAWPEPVDAALAQALQAANGKSLREAMEILSAQAALIAKEFGKHEYAAEAEEAP